MQNTAADYYIEKIQSQDLYNRDIEEFFLKHYVYKTIYHRGDPLIKNENMSTESVAFVGSGRFKIYLITFDGNKLFAGYIPQYSTIMPFGNNIDEIKTSVADTDSVVYIGHLDDYLRFLQTSPDIINHQLQEPYNRRYANDFSRNDTLGHSARVKVSVFLLCIGLRFGTADPESEASIIVNNPPTIADIASYTDVHRSNVSRYINELAKNGYIAYSKTQLTLLDADKFSRYIEELKDSKSGADKK